MTTKLSKRIIAIFLCVMMLCGNFMVTGSAADVEYTSGNYTYTVSSSKTTIIAYKETATGNVEIPEKLGGYPVVKIDEYAFFGCTLIESVVIPTSVKEIGKYAFAYCMTLASVKIPSSVTSIGEKAFNNSKKVVIQCPKGSYAEKYSKSNGLTVELKGIEDGGVIGIFNDYVITVILNGTDTYVSSITLDGVEYTVKENVLPFKSSKQYDPYKGKEMYARISDGEVVDLLLTSLDTDNDGLYDYWEKYGIDYDKDCSVEVEIDKMGANYSKKDIFVEVDWMREFGPTTQEYFDSVSQEFERHNIQLHVDAGPRSVDYVTGKTWDSYPGGSGGNEIPYVNEYNTFNRIFSIANSYFSSARRCAFHYCLFAENLGGAGGVSYLNHQLLTVLGGTEMSDWAKGAAFMHELGHNLGLQHGGCDALNNKPNYLSNMNYIFAYSNDLAYKYSDYLLPTIDENSLNETVGIDPAGLTAGTGIHTILKHGGREDLYLASRTPLDYNNDGDTNDVGIRVDICNRSQATVADTIVSYDVLKSQNDWNVLNLKGNEIGTVSKTGVIEFTEKAKDVVPVEPTIDDLRDAGMFPMRAEGTESSVSINDLQIIYKQSATITEKINIEGEYSVKYTSSNPNVATVDNNGNVYGAKKGDATITCTVTDEAGNSVSDTCKVTVKYAWWQWLIKIVLFGWIWY